MQGRAHRSSRAHAGDSRMQAGPRPPRERQNFPVKKRTSTGMTVSPPGVANLMHVESTAGEPLK